MNQGKLKVVKQEMTRVNIDILGPEAILRVFLGEGVLIITTTK